ncbi:nucleotide-diphospho-sugar transferase [Kockiozyma suomiensis]|uniref:nucleotide-diphospho-sugar transferase n=1 Tax=Kockiozyma suomiensis TaxID=1337062 RepID=UPI00334390A3
MRILAPRKVPRCLSAFFIVFCLIFALAAILHALHRIEIVDHAYLDRVTSSIGISDSSLYTDSGATDADAAPSGKNIPQTVSDVTPADSFSSSSSGGQVLVDNNIEIRRENATFVMLVRNSEVHNARTSIRYVEDRFNKNYHYPWLFLNDRPFSADFIRMTKNLVSGEPTYAQIPREVWSMPEWVDRQKARERMREMAAKNILYGGSESYRHMCRFFSGFMYRMEEMQKYDYYWRVEPDTQLYCDIDYDPFTFMRENKKKYGFVISLKEFASTIETLWPTVQNFSIAHPEYIHPNNALEFIVDDKRNITEGGYNLCHFWSNFEIAAMDFWRSPAYTELFEALDRSGGFFYERWGDAPVHSVAASLLLDKEEIHWFYDVGYRHHPFTHCPEPRKEYHESGKCYCNPTQNFDRNAYSCTRQYRRMRGDLGVQKSVSQLLEDRKHAKAVPALSI